MSQEKIEEQKHLDYCMDIIEDNIKTYSERFKVMKEDIKEMYDSYRSDNPELHNDLVIAISFENQAKQVLRKNQVAKKKAYFGRGDYFDK